MALQFLRDLRAPSVCNNDESFYSFSQRRFGSEIAKYAIDPLCRGVFAGNARDISVMALAKRIHDVEKKYNSVIKGLLLDRNAPTFDHTLKCFLVDKAKKEKWAVWSLQGGLETLVHAIETRLKNSNVEIVKGAKISKIAVTKGNKVTIITDKETYTVDKAISCLPAIVLKNLVKDWNHYLYSLLNDIPYVTVGIVNLEFSQNIITQPAFGYLVPSSEPSKVLGVIYDTCSFPQGNKTVLTVMMGGSWFKELFGDNPSQETLLNIALEEIGSTFNTTAKPTSFKVSVLKDCIPQYTVGHLERVLNAKKLLKDSPLYLAGNSYDGVGVNDAIYNTKKIVESFL